MTNEIQKQYDRLDDVPSIMLRMKEIYAVPDRHIRYAVTKAFFRIKMAKGSFVQSHGVKMLSLLEKLEDLKAGLDNDTYFDALTSKAKGKSAGCWKTKKGKRKVVTATASTEGTPAAPNEKGKGKVRGFHGSKANDVCIHYQGNGNWTHNSSPTQVLERSRRLSKDEMILRLGDGKAIATEAVGSLSLVISNHIRIELKDCIYVSSMIKNIISIPVLDNDGYAFMIDTHGHISKDTIRKLVNSKSLEGYALETAAKLLNMASSKTVPQTPYEIWHGKPASYKYLRVCGSPAYVKRIVGDRVCAGFPADSRRDEVLLEESSEAPQQNDATPFEPSVPTDGVPILRRSTRESRPPERYGFVGLNSQLDNDPRTYEEAMSDIDSDKWIEAMKSKMDSMGSNHVWTLVDPPKGVRPVGCKWVYKRKLEADGEVTAFKARLVVKGYAQRPGANFEETYSPVAMAKSIQILLAIAAWYDYEIWQMDVKTAFLNGFVKEDLYGSAGGFHFRWRRTEGLSSSNVHLRPQISFGPRVLMKSYGVMISSRMSMILVYTRRSVGAPLRTLCFMSMTSYSLGMTTRC
ncbi:UNVERIFIED_CONTAM: Retrovirus-related Pol polyprotein from transposon TNT 1-94 [Sesamum latifolium]|uniref:Retrovirus-related Pol polyprotein from transposon TNT 1-94 n=1 Tax=Sesamum latifolium TaxID=2727402 RepID=A0AAW2XJC2_9LAMI